MTKHIIFSIILFLSLDLSFAQKITYSEPDRDDSRDTKFEIIGKLNGKFLVYKSTSNAHYIYVFDAEMKLANKVKIDYLTERVFNVDFVKYPDFGYLFYQYQKRNIIYCMAAKIDADGNKIGEVIQLDTTDSREVQNNKIYSFVQSADKQKIAFFKVNTVSDKVHFITTILFDNNLTLINKSSEAIAMKERNSFLTSFELDNNGCFIFLKATSTNGSDNINKLTLITKELNQATCSYKEIKKPESIYLDEVKVKADNINQQYIITSLYSNKRRGDIQGMYVSLWGMKSKTEKTFSITAFGDEFRNDAKGDASIKAAFNDYFIKEIVATKDAGFLAITECEYTSSRGGNNLNRWDYLNNSPFNGPGSFYALGSPGFNSYPWSRFGNTFNVTRYYADNIAIVSFDSTGKIKWSNLVRKSQFDDDVDGFIGFGMFNAGSQLKFLFNVLERGQKILNEQSLTPEGEIIRSSTLRGLDKGYDFMPRNAKQVGAKQIIVPCMLRSFLCFAKIDY
jgi:hypothetical protein